MELHPDFWRCSRDTLSSLLNSEIMRKTTLLFLLVGLTLASTFTSCGKKELYKSEEGKFSILFDGKPDVTSEEVPTAVGAVEVHMFMYEKTKSHVQIVGYSDYPPVLVSLQDPMDMLKNAEMGMVTNMNATSTDQKSSEFDGNKAYEFRASGSQDGKPFNMAYKLIMVNNRLYQIGIMKEAEDISDEEVKSFIGSFELLKN